MATRRNSKQRKPPADDAFHEALGSGNWGQFARPPRSVPGSIRLRLALAESGFGRSLLRSLLVVIPTYCLAAIGLRSTSMALVLFLACFSGKSLFPIGILVVLFQSLLLTLVDWKGRGLWVEEESS